MQFITFQNFHIQTWFSQFLWFFSLKCWFKGQMISRIHLILPNAYKLMCFDRNINGNRDVKFLECDKWSLHWYENLTLSKSRLLNPSWIVLIWLVKLPSVVNHKLSIYVAFFFHELHWYALSIWSCTDIITNQAFRVLLSLINYSVVL